MKPNHHELTLQLWDLLTKEEIEKGYVFITYKVDVSILIHIGSSMVDEVLKKSPYKDHIIGFKRVDGTISISLDEEGQKKWDVESKRKAEYCLRYNN